MKWYFASRVRHQSKIIEISRFLVDLGETVVSDWVHKGSLKPYSENLSEVQIFSEEVVRSLLSADIFVLISDPEGTDMFVELGVCLAHNSLTQKPRIYIVGEHSKRSIMQLHPSVIHAKDIIEVFKFEGIETRNFVPVDFTA
ncbi:MAG TPA: hypothetical protein VIR98_03185 [Candidatus Paceibacterota bacterium]|jgi:hypothetical protein